MGIRLGRNAATQAAIRRQATSRQERMPFQPSELDIEEEGRKVDTQSAGDTPSETQPRQLQPA